MSTNFPSTLDTFTNPNGLDSLNAAAVPHAEQHANANDAIEALQAKVGINGSAVATSLDYRISAAETGLDGKISSSEKGAANGVATLGFDGKVPSSQLPPLDYIPTSEKGAAGGVAGLDEAGKVPAAQLPSYVDDVLEYANLAAFPVTGEAGKIYVALDTNKTYRWSSSTYIYITSGAVDSVAGKTGVVVLAKADVGLGSVDNTADVAKPISTAQQTALDLKAPLNSPALTGTASITANSNDPALKITQTGAGNALVVEGAASDTTPFVIAADGAVGIGTASPEFGGLTVAKVGDYSLVLKGDDYVTAQIRSYRESSSDHAQLNAFAARGTESAPTILASSDRVLTIKSHGWDGAGWVRAAEIRADIDNTPAAGSMPGRLTFSTTPSGSATPVERMLINSVGNVAIGGSPTSGSSLLTTKNITGAANSASIVARGEIQSDCTAYGAGVLSWTSVADAPFTLPDWYHFRAVQGVKGASATVTRQYGFYADSTLVGAASNYGFYGGLNAGTGRYNLYMGGNADNYLAGRLAIGTSPTATSSLAIGKTITGGSTAVAIYNNGVIQSDVGTAYYNRVEIGTAAAAFTLGAAYAYIARQGTVGAGSSITAQYGFVASSDLYKAVSNYSFFADDIGGANATTGKSNVGFRSNLSAATGGGSAWNFYATGTAPNYFAGSVGVGSTSLTGINLAVVKNITGASSSYNIACNGTVQSDVTGGAFGISTYLGTQAATFTLPWLRHVSAGQNTFGAGSTVTNQYGFIAESTLTGATNNYGFYSNLSAGTGRWNFYAAGTAANYFAGNVTANAAFNQTPTRSTVASGSTVTLTTGTNHLLYDQAATVAALTVTLPSASLTDGQVITIATRSAITALTVNGGTIYGAPITLAEGGFCSFIYSSSAAAWFRKG